MLNELLLVERGAREAGITMVERHPDLKDVRRVPTLVVRLDGEGRVESVWPMPKEVSPWTLRDGQHNSFPFVQKVPLVSANQEDDRRAVALDKRAETSARRVALLDLVAGAPLDAAPGWPGGRLIKRLQERRLQLRSLEGTPGAIVVDTIDRFLRAVEPRLGGDPRQLLQEMADKLVTELQSNAQDEWLDVGIALLIGEPQPAKGIWESSGAILFEAAQAQADLAIFGQKIAQQVSQALRQADAAAAESGELAICALTGLPSRLLSGPFPQPNLPVLGQTFLFARNVVIPAQGRYGRFADTMPAGADTVIRLASALEALTSDDRRGVTWRSIPGEAPKQSDLLLAFVEQQLELEAVGILGGSEEEEDFSEELPANPEARVADSIAVFEKRTSRVIEAVRAKVNADLTKTRVQIAVFRKVDPANRKVAYAGTAQVADLERASKDWATGERNLPPWIRLPIFLKGERKSSLMPPPHVAPLGVIQLSKQIFLRQGQHRQEAVGLPAAEALALFLEPVGKEKRAARLRAERVLRLVLRRRAVLVFATAGELLRRNDSPTKLDYRETLRTISMLGLLLHKLGRAKEEYMSSTAFKLGQLLAAADVVHAGYCADVRGGGLPPSLLGNQVFTMAQTNPNKALAALSRRWKPYVGWVTKTERDRQRTEGLVASKKKEEQQRGWAILRALRHAREMRALAEELAVSLAEGHVPDDAFRAELLLGYMAGLPKSQKQESTTTDDNESPVGQEE